MSLKTLREKLCQEQTMSTFPIDVDGEINNLIRLIDEHRPLMADGKHGHLHTKTCGCEDKS